MAVFKEYVHSEDYAIDKAVEITAAYASSSNTGNEKALSNVFKTMYDEIFKIAQKIIDQRNSPR